MAYNQISIRSLSLRRFWLNIAPSQRGSAGMPLFMFFDAWPARSIEAYFTENSQIERRDSSFPVDSPILIGRSTIWQENLSERQLFSQLMDQ
jgi:hypothetical protein